MNTTTHALIGLSLLGKRGHPVRNRWVLFGSLLPDIAIFIWGAWHMVVLRTDSRELWGTLYFEPTMQLIIAPWNSIPLLAGVGALAWWQSRRTKARWPLYLSLVCVAGLIHIAFDIPVHSEDAYRHFWPLSDWRYQSPLSYWKSADNARWVSVVEGLVTVVCAVVLWRRFPHAWSRALVVLIAVATLGLGLYFFNVWT